MKPREPNGAADGSLRQALCHLKTRKIFVDPTVPGLDQIQVGDQVVLLLTRPAAVNFKTI